MLAGGMPSPELANFLNGLPLWLKVLWAAGCGAAAIATIILRRDR